MYESIASGLIAVLTWILSIPPHMLHCWFRVVLATHRMEVLKFLP